MIQLNPNLRDRKNIDKEYLCEAKKFLQRIIPGYTDTRWHHLYSTNNGMKKVAYIPEDIFAAYIEPALNKIEFATAISDKLSYDNYFSKSDMPATFYKVLNDEYFNSENIRISKAEVIQNLNTIDVGLVMKPALSSGGGRGIVVAHAKEIASLLQTNESYFSGCYIIQEEIKQHPLMAKFHPSSLNTCKINTARINSEIVVLGSFQRFGLNKSRIDNGSQGGMACSVNEQGVITDHAIDGMLYKQYKKHPDTGVVFKDFSIPGYQEAVKLCTNYHKKFLHFTFIGWDIGIKEDGSPVIIEINLRKQGIDWLQYFNGPLFGKNTEYFLEQYKKSEKHRFGIKNAL